MQRVCVVCSGPYEAVRPQAKYCGETCKKRAQREGIAASRRGSAAPASSAEANPVRPVTGLLDSVRAELEVLKKLNSVSGQHALEIAGRIASAPGMNTGVAALSKELSRVLAEARATATVVADPVDELGKRRDAKLQRAAG